MNHLKAVAFAAGLMVLAGCVGTVEDTSADEAVIRASAPAFAKAFNEGDADKLAVAYEAGLFTVQDGAGATVDTGKYVGVFEKWDGKWLYIRDTWNSDSPPPPAAEPGA